MEDFLPQFIPSRAFQAFLYSQKYVLGTSTVASVRKQTIPTERLPYVCEISANFCG
jgi:hypothetical protein